MRKFRDKVFAHYDDISKEKEKNTISIDDLQSTFKITEQIINKIEVFYDRVITILNPINVADVFQLCFVVKNTENTKKNNLIKNAMEIEK